MEEITFKMFKHNKVNFESDLNSILHDNDITCNQREYDIFDDYILYRVPKYCLKNISDEELELLNSHSV